MKRDNATDFVRMIRGFPAAAVFAVAALFAFSSVFCPAAPAYGREYQPDTLIVKYKTGVYPSQAQAVNRKHGVVTLKTMDRLNAHAVKTTGTMPLELKIKELELDPAVEYAEPNYRRSITVTTPSDSYYASQWNLPKIRADYAWDIQKGSSGIIVAVIDTGVSLNHPDLSGRIVAGYDFVDNDSVPADENGHGTHVAGIAAASTNNGTGVAGVDWNARIMPVRVLDSDGSGWDYDVVDGIIWAVDNGADVINMSLGGPSPNPSTLQAAIDYAYDHGVVVVAAAGNDALKGNPVFYPASCNNTISVAAVDRYDTRASYSEYNEYVDVAAPGGDMNAAHTDWVLSTYWSSSGGNAYAWSCGTSMASPHVAGLAALLLSHYPTATPDQIEAAITNTAVDLGTAGRDDLYGHGRIDAWSALNYGGFAVDHFTVETAASQTAGAPFAVTVTARDAGGTVKTSFTQAVQLTDSSGTISPATSGSFAAGIWSGNVTITKAGVTAITVLYGPAPAGGTSQVITIAAGNLDRIAIVPALTTVQCLSSAQFYAFGYDAYNNLKDAAQAEWSATGGTVDPAVGSSTEFTAGSLPGNHTVAASLSGITGTASVRTFAFSKINALYNYGGATSRVWSFTSNGGDLAPQNAWSSGAGSFDAGRVKMVGGDYNGDGRRDVAMLYDYDGGISRLWVFLADGSGLMTPHLGWTGTSFDAGRVKMVGGDYDGDGKDDIGMLYDYGGATSRIWTFTSTGTQNAPVFTPKVGWYGGAGSFDAGRVTLTD
jgi:thermitase